MPTAQYTALANITLGSSQASIVFSSIASGYRDYIIVFNGINSGAGENYAYLYFNGDTGANYSRLEAYGDGSAPGVFTASNLIIYEMPPSGSAYRSTMITQIMDATATDKHKTVIYRNSAPSAPQTGMGVGRWASTAAITSITITGYSGNIGAGTSIALYGVK